MAIKKTTFLGFEAIELENDYLKALILPTEGCNLVSLVEKTKGFEVLRTPKTKEEYLGRRMVWGTPILFPPNRIENGTFKFDGRVYKLELNRIRENENNHIHGFVHDKEWELLETNDTQNILRFRIKSLDFAHIFNQYPHDFELIVEYRLDYNKITQTLQVLNKGNENIPVGVGYHTTFNFHNGLSILQMELDKRWVFNSNSLPTGKFDVPEISNEIKSGTKLINHPLDDEFIMTENKIATIIHPHENIEIKYEADEQFKHWVLFNGDGQSDYLSIEPYSWITNAPNLELPDSLTGMYSLKPGVMRELTTSILIENK